MILTTLKLHEVGGAGANQVNRETRAAMPLSRTKNRTAVARDAGCMVAFSPAATEIVAGAEESAETSFLGPI